MSPLFVYVQPKLEYCDVFDVDNIVVLFYYDFSLSCDYIYFHYTMFGGFLCFCKYFLMLNVVLNIKARGVDIEDADQSEHWLSANFPIGILGQVWYLIVSIPDLCTLTYFGMKSECCSCFFAHAQRALFIHCSSYSFINIHEVDLLNEKMHYLRVYTVRLSAIYRPCQQYFKHDEPTHRT